MGILDNTPTIRNAKREGAEEERRRLEGELLREQSQELLAIVQARFPELKELAELIVEKVTASRVVRQTIVQVSIASDTQEAKQVLTDLNESFGGKKG